MSLNCLFQNSQTQSETMKFGLHSTNFSRKVKGLFFSRLMKKKIFFKKKKGPLELFSWIRLFAFLPSDCLGSRSEGRFLPNVEQGGGKHENALLINLSFCYSL